MSVSILIVDGESDMADFFESGFAVRPAMGRMCCITPPRGQNRWIGSHV